MAESDTSRLFYQQIETILFFGVVGALVAWIAWSKGYFRFPTAVKHATAALITGKEVCAVFAIYLAFALFISPFLFSTILGPLLNSEGGMAWGQLLNLLLIGASLYLYIHFKKKIEVSKIWKNRDLESSRPVLSDVGMGILSWAISFPIIATVSQFADLFLFLFFKVEQYEQVAVHYLKMSLDSPVPLAVALITVLLAAPILEEFLFRGCLQTYFKRHLGMKAAILLSSLCFAIFHISGSQGLGNISLGISLFAFACFLGFIYERQGSLFASIALHSSFNAVSAFRIIFMPEG